MLILNDLYNFQTAKQPIRRLLLARPKRIFFKKKSIKLLFFLHMLKKSSIFAADLYKYILSIMNAESLYSRRSNLIIAFHGCDQSLVNNSMQITINQMFNFTPPIANLL